MSLIKKSNFLCQSDIQRLFEKEYIAIYIPNYISFEQCDALAHKALNHNNLENYHHELRENNKITYLDYGVDRIGKSFNTTYDNQPKRKSQYYEEAVRITAAMRAFLPNQLMPFDKFRLEFDENWPHAVSLGYFEKRKMFAGMLRVMQRPDATERISKQPHVDFLPEQFEELAGQFTVNIYLKTTDHGGDLELWNVPPLQSSQARELETNYDWRSQLPKPLLIKPHAGDLIMFNSRCPHAVTSFTQGQRVSIQSFIGLKKNNQVVLWS